MLLDIFGLAERLGGLRVVTLSLRLNHGHSVLHFAGHHGESVFDVHAFLSRGLQESNIEVFGEFLALFLGNLTLGLKIALVTDKDARDVVTSILLNLIHPGLHSVERFTVSDVIGDNDTMGTLVVRGSDGLEALLTGSVPL